jgi:hypothetical protein
VISLETGNPKEMKSDLSVAKYSMVEYDSSVSGEVICHDFSDEQEHFLNVKVFSNNCDVQAM